MRAPYIKLGVYKWNWKINGDGSRRLKTFETTEREIWIDNIKISSGSATNTDNKAPSAPTKLKASSITQTSIKLNWNASSDNVGVAGYEVNYNGKTKSVTGTSTTLTGLRPNVNYSIKVRAKDTSGNKSSYSNPETAVTDATVGIYPILVANAGLDKEKRCGDSYRTLGKASSKPTSDGAIYLWTTTNGQISGAINGKTAKGTKAGTYTLTVSKSGYTAAKDTVVITQEKGCATTQPVVNKPKAATLIGPSENADTTPTYTWNAVSGAEWYYLWSRDNQGNIHKKWYKKSALACESGEGTCSITPETTLAAGKAKWYVISWNKSGFSSWSQGMTFTVTDPEDPTATVPDSPENFSKTAPKLPGAPEDVVSKNDKESGGSFGFLLLPLALIGLRRRVTTQKS
jgi:chitodextrinase